jgi:hypothetical protein
MIKKVLFCIALFCAVQVSAVSTARGGVKLDLANSLVELTIKCLDCKFENVMFRDALEAMRALLEDLGCSAREKERLQQKIATLLAILDEIDADNADTYAQAVQSFADGQ